MEISKILKRKKKEEVTSEIKEKKKINIKDIWNRFLDLFRYKGYVLRKKENEYHDRLLKQAFDSSGVIDYKDGCLVTRDNKLYKIFRLEFKEPNGLSEDVDRMNYQGLTQIQDVLTDDYSIAFPQEHKYNLQNNITFYENCLKNEKMESRKEVIRELLRLMYIFNEVKYVSMIMYISIADVEKFKKVASDICEVTELDQYESSVYLEQINNEIQ